MKMILESAPPFDLWVMSSSVASISNSGSLTSSLSSSNVSIVTLGLGFAPDGSRPFSVSASTEALLFGRTVIVSDTAPWSESGTVSVFASSVVVPASSGGSTRWIPPMMRKCPCFSVHTGRSHSVTINSTRILTFTRSLPNLVQWKPTPLVFHSFRRERGGFNPTPLIFDAFRPERGEFNLTPLVFHAFRHERGGFNPTPLVFDVFVRKGGGFNPTPLFFHMFQHERGELNPTPLLFIQLSEGPCTLLIVWFLMY